MADRLIAAHVTNRFGSVTALDDVSIEFNAGEIHAVLGENGAGKSTLMHILGGFMSPDSGRVLLDGNPLTLGQAHKFRDAGIEMVHQHFTLVPNFTVEENLALPRLPRLASFLNVHRLAGNALDIAKQFGWSIDPKAKVGSLPVGVQQRIEILKCLAADGSVLIFDEPTAVLTPNEVFDLIRVLKKLRDEGKIIILIAHKLSEVMATADRVTVLRGGKWIASAPIADVNEKQLATWMVGDMPELHSAPQGAVRSEGLTAKDLKVSGDRGEPSVRTASFSISQGEIVGFGGVDGNGQVELAEALALIRPLASGQILWKNQPVANEQIRIAYIPQDRQEDGLALSLSIEENLLIEGQYRADLKRGPFINFKAFREWCQSLIEKFEIKIASTKQQASDLSGGNQQKIVVSRNLDIKPDLLVAVNPTRGLDVRATQYVRDQIRIAKSNGAAVALFSTDLDELTELSDRIVFMSRGEISERQGATALVGGST